MNYRELHNVDFIGIEINGAGEYTLPRPVFADKTINSLFIWDYNEDMYNGNLFVTIYTVEKKPLFINIPAIEFSFDNINNFINETIDFDLFKITYTGNKTFTLGCWFSSDEKYITSDEVSSSNWKSKNIHLNLETIAYEEISQKYSDWKFDFFSNIADFFRGKKIRRISIDGIPLVSFNFVFKSGKTITNIPFVFLRQTIVGAYGNTMPFIINDEIDLERSWIDYNIDGDGNSDGDDSLSFLDLIFYYE